MSSQAASNMFALFSTLEKKPLKKAPKAQVFERVSFERKIDLIEPKVYPEFIPVKAIEIPPIIEIKVENKSKTLPCKYGTRCNRTDCNFAHHKDELNILPCNFGLSCNRYSISNIENPCLFLHPNESRDLFFARTGLFLKQQIFQSITYQPDLQLDNTRTVPCGYGLGCTNPNCNYAHSEKDLRILPCAFGIRCTRFNSQDMPCQFLHPNESHDFYYSRTGLTKPVFKSKMNDAPRKRIDLSGNNHSTLLGAKCFNDWGPCFD